MSALSDLFEGNFNQIGGDFTSPSAISEFEDAGIALGGLALGGLGFGALGGLGALGADAGLLGADAGLAAGAGGLDLAAGGGGTLAADLGIADIAGAAGGADLTGAAAGAVADLGAGSAPFDVGALTADAGAGASVTDPLALAPSDFSSFGADTGSTAFDPGSGASTSDPFASSTLQPSQAPDAGSVTTSPGTASTATGLPTGPTVNASTMGTGAGATSGGTVSGMGGAAPATSGGATGTLNSILSSPWTKLATGAVPLALTLGMGEQQLPAGAQQLQQQALTLQQTGLTDLQAARSGVMNAGQTAQLAQMRADLTNQWLQTLKNQGVQDPTKDARWPQIQAAIDAQVTQQTQTFIQNNVQNALAETGQASSALTSIANMQFSADQQFTNNLVNATKSLGLAAGTSNLPKITIG